MVAAFLDLSKIFDTDINLTTLIYILNPYKPTKEVSFRIISLFSLIAKNSESLLLPILKNNFPKWLHIYE